MIKGFSIKNMALAALTGALVATNFHVSGLSATDMAVYIVITSIAAWAAVEELEIRYGKRREKRAREDRRSLRTVCTEEKLAGSESRL